MSAIVLLPLSQLDALSSRKFTVDSAWKVGQLKTKLMIFPLHNAIYQEEVKSI